MRAALLVAASVGLLVTVHGQMPAPTAAAAPRTGMGLLLGRVLEGQTTRGLPGVLVTLTGGGAAPQKVYVDGEGRFLFTNLPDGEFTLTAAKAGYLGGLSGQRAPRGPSRPIPLASGERRTDVSVRLWKFAAVSGMVTGDSGEPAVGVEVRLVERVLVDGRRVLSAAPPVTVPTDDRGAYRFSTVAPGEYILFARSPADSGERALVSIAMADQSAIMAIASRAASGHLEDIVDIDTTLRVYPPTFYPAAASPADAEVIRVGAGEERTGVDIRTAVVPVTRVSGTLLHQGQPVISTQVRLTLAGEEGEIDVATGRSAKDGAFTMVGVPAGRYTLRAARTPRNAMTTGAARGRGGAMPQPTLATEPTLWGAQVVNTGEPGSTSVTIGMQTAAQISGRFEFRNAAGRPTPEQLQQTWRIAAASATTPTSVTGRIEADGTFTIPGLQPGPYRLRVNGSSPAQSATVNGVDLLDTPVTIGAADVTDVIVTVTDDAAGAIAGAVRNPSGAPDRESVVLILPADERLIGDRRMKISRTAADGTFSVPGLPAGDYVVAVSTDEQLDAGLDRETLLRIIQTGAPIALRPGERRTIALRSEGSR